MSRPPTNFDKGLQHERTALAWERTAISLMVAGVVLGRFAAVEAFWAAAVVGLAIVVIGGGLLVWAGSHYDDLHGILRAGSSVVYPTVVRLIGLTTVTVTATALLLGIVVAWRG